MSATLAIAGRECRAMFFTPAGYIIICIFAMALGVVFSLAAVFEQGQLATLQLLFTWSGWLLMLICPAVSMRAISEELRLGTFESLVTSPVSEAQIVLGKFLGSLAFLIALLLPTLAFVAALEVYGRPDYGELACGYVGILIAGSAYLATGVLASSLTPSQVLAFLLSVFFWLSLGLTTTLLPHQLTHETAVKIAYALNPIHRLNDFAIGLVDTSNIIYFVSFAAIFLALAVLSLKLRRVL